MKRGRLIVIVGPTAVGKTEFAVRLAERLQTEIVSADSRQIFREMDIGTAKPSDTQLTRVKHHFVNTHSIAQEYDAGQFGRDATAVVEELLTRKADAILCGGSGLYVRAVCEGFDEMPAVPENVRTEIVQSYQQNGLEWLQKRVEQLDPVYFAEVDQKNPQRLMRALELLQVSGTSVTALRQKKELIHPFDICKIGLSMNRETLYQRIDQRMDQMIADGLMEEAMRLYPQRHLNALQTVGYSEWFGFFDKNYDRDEAVRLLKRNSRRYAKRQLTWFGKDSSVTWFDASDADQLMSRVLHFLKVE